MVALELEGTLDDDRDLQVDGDSAGPARRREHGESWRTRTLEVDGVGDVVGCHVSVSPPSLKSVGCLVDELRLPPGIISSEFELCEVGSRVSFSVRTAPHHVAVIEVVGQDGHPDALADQS